jgi:hypothetical protein
VVLVFPAFSEPGRCLNRVVLQLRNVRGTAGPLAIYPSAALSLGRGMLPPKSDGNANTLLDNRPRADGKSDATQGLLFDVTDLARLWADGGPFPSQGRTLPGHSLFVLHLRPPDLATGRYGIAFSPEDVALVVSTNAGC